MGMGNDINGITHYTCPGATYEFHQPHYGEGEINVSQFITVEDHDGTLRVCTYNLDVPWHIIELLYDCVFDREGVERVIDNNLETEFCIKCNADKSLVEMQRIFSRCRSLGHCPDYLAPYSYRDAYVRGAECPNDGEYRRKLLEIEQRIVQEWVLAWQKKSEEEWNEYCEANVARRDMSRIELADCHQEYLLRRLQTCDGEIRASVARAVQKEVCELKREYYCQARQYIYAWKYAEGLRRTRVLDRLGHDIKMYSTDTIGWTDFDYPVSNDVHIRVRTNFGFGVTSYFQVVLSYKGIPILPYSLYVNYYYANSRDLTRYTRNYFPRRKNWRVAFEFVATTANMAESDPDGFVRGWMMREVEDMIDGLRKIVNDPHSVIDYWLNKMGSSGDESPYLHVRAIDGKAKSYYECYPDEMVIDLKAKKMSGALDFIESLRSLEVICNEVGNAIATILELAVNIVPEISNAIESASRDVDRFNELKAAWLRRQGILQRRLTLMDEEIGRRVAECVRHMGRPLSSDVEKRAILVAEAKCYYASHPEYELHAKAVSWCGRKIVALSNDIMFRTKFREDLVKCREKIVSHHAQNVREA